MAMIIITIAVLVSLAFVGWLIYRMVKGKPIKAHLVMYGLSCLTGIFTLAFFLTMDIPRIIMVLVCIMLGAALIFLAAYLQRRRQPDKP